MKTEIKKQWIDKVQETKDDGETPKYGHIWTILKYEESYSIFGILCELYKESHNEVEWVWEKSKNTFLGYSHSLPMEVKEWAGLERCDPYIYPELKQNPHSNTSYEKLTLSIYESEYPNAQLPFFATVIRDNF